MKMMSGVVASFGVVTTGEQGRVNNRGGVFGNFFLLNDNGGSTVIAAVLDGPLQELAGEVGRAVRAAVRTVDDGGGSNRAVHNGSAIAAHMMMKMMSGVVASFGVVTAGEQGRVNNRGGVFGNFFLLNDNGPRHAYVGLTRGCLHCHK